MTPNHENVPRIVLGSMTFGLDETQSETALIRVRGAEKVKPFLDTFTNHGHVEVDTARIYGRGDTEIVLGQLPLSSLKIGTKVFPFEDGAFTSQKLRDQFTLSLEALKATKVDIFYLHSPDFATPMEETLKTVDELYREGRFDRFGLSNYAAWQVAQCYEMCKRLGYVLPSVYQGIYNPISRSVVPELLPCLRELNISFYAYSPSAGGLLTGHYKFDEDVSEGSRYDVNTGFGKVFRAQHWNKLTFDGLQILNKAAKENNIPLLEATLRWMRHHSQLEAKDGIIIGASSLKHLEDNLADLDKGPLPQGMLNAFDEAWEKIQPAAISYFRTAETRFPVPKQ